MIGAQVDHFIEEQGLLFAGRHLLIDFYGIKESTLSDIEKMRQVMIEAINASEATLLHIHLHHFGQGGGISGVAILAESHISVHTWPERQFAAFDIFMCGKAKPHNALEVIKHAFPSERCECRVEKRGVMNKHD